MGNNDAKEMLAVCKKEAVRIEAELEHLREVAELHEIATERTVQLAAVIEKAKAEQSVTIGETGDPDLLVFLAKRAENVSNILASVDTAAVLRERDAEKWDEGARDGWDACFAWESGKAEHSQPVNPYREGD